MMQHSINSREFLSLQESVIFERLMNQVHSYQMGNGMLLSNMNSHLFSLSPFFVPRILNNLPASNVSIRFGFAGPCVSNNMACASSAYSILEGLHSIRNGECEMALVGGSESCIGRTSYHGFGSMHALSTQFNDCPQAGSRPFDKRRGGFVMGEGGGR